MISEPLKSAVTITARTVIELQSITITIVIDPMPVCTISESLNHGPTALWSHLKLILIDIMSANPNLYNRFLVMGLSYYTIKAKGQMKDKNCPVPCIV